MTFDVTCMRMSYFLSDYRFVHPNDVGVFLKNGTRNRLIFMTTLIHSAANMHTAFLLKVLVTIVSIVIIIISQVLQSL